MEEQQGNAAESPAVAESILGLLRHIGLVGPRLALQVGEEEMLATQLAERLGVRMEGWITELVKVQVKSAIDTMEMDLRVRGDHASPGHQAIRDAVEFTVKQSQTAASSKQVAPVQPAVVIPMKGRLTKQVKIPFRQQRTLEKQEQHILEVLHEELVAFGAPVLERMKEVANQERARASLLGPYRPSTARRYLAYWQGFRKWVVATTGQMPSRGIQLVDYLYVREEEGMGPSVPLSVSKGVAWFEKVAGLEEEERFTSEPLVDLVVRDLLKKLEDAAPPRKRAPRLLSSFMAPLEDLVMDLKKDDRLRAGAWFKLVKVWASLRFDDAARLRLDMVKSYDGKFSGILRRTKTTGGGKRVKELPFHVSAEAWVSRPEWLATGLEVLGRIRGAGPELLIPAGVSQVDGPVEGAMTYQEAVAWSLDVLKNIEHDDGQPLIPETWERFWSEHSERSTLTSCLAAVGVAKPDRDLLGRWKPEGSDTYIRTYNAAVTRMQHQYAKVIRSGQGYKEFDEGSVLEELKTWLVNQWGVREDIASTAVENWKPRIAPDFSFVEMVEKGNQPEADDPTGGQATPVVSLFANRGGKEQL